MPSVDREAVKTLAVAIGVREAARKLGLNEDTVCSWARRGKWFAPTPTPKSQAIDLQALHATPSMALASYGKSTRLHLAKASHKASEHLAEQPAEAILDRSQAMRHVSAVASQVHGWEQNQGQQGALDIQVLTGEVGIRVRTSPPN